MLCRLDLTCGWRGNLVTPSRPADRQLFTTKARSHEGAPLRGFVVKLSMPGSAGTALTRNNLQILIHFARCGSSHSESGILRRPGPSGRVRPMQDLAHPRPPAILPAILEETGKMGFPMASEPQTGALLRVLAAAKPGAQFLELGTGTGLSTAWLLDGMDQDARLTSVDVDPTVQAIARKYLGSDPRLQLVTADAGIFLRQQAPASFDFIFADAMPGKYESLNEALALLRRGGLYVIDDMLPQPSWPIGHAPRVPQLIDDLANRPGYQLAALAWSSGLVVVARTA
jgi:predicted O-methyltransferase YrrM